MDDLARLRIWDDPAIRRALAWYLDVAENHRPAKFRIAATVGLSLDPATSSEDALWAELDRLTPFFLARWQAIREGTRLPQAADGPSLLELCRELAYRMLAHCNFCRMRRSTSWRSSVPTISAIWPVRSTATNTRRLAAARPARNSTGPGAARANWGCISRPPRSNAETPSQCRHYCDTGLPRAPRCDLPTSRTAAMVRRHPPGERAFG
jgi:hypothetical protein